MTLEQTLTERRPPVRLDEDGTLRVSDTRVLLEAVVYLYRAGEDALGIQDAYPSLSPADVHGAIAYYLQYWQDVDAYVLRRERMGEELRRKIEEASPTTALRARLKAGRAEVEHP